MIKLSPFTTDDFQQLIEWIPNAAFTMQWGGPSFTYPLTVEQLEHYLKGAHDSNGATYIFKAIDIELELIIGHISINSIDYENRSGKIGKVLIGPTMSRSKGYGQMLMTAAIQFAFHELQLAKLSLNVFDFNIAAIRCYEKVGFKKEILIKEARKFNDTYWNLYQMSITKDEWLSSLK